MANSKIIEGEGEAFFGSESLGQVRYRLIHVIQPDRQWANGTLDFEVEPRRELNFTRVEVRPANGPAFKLGLAERRGTHAEVKSDGYIPKA